MSHKTDEARHAVEQAMATLQGHDDISVLIEVTLADGTTVGMSRGPTVFPPVEPGPDDR